MIKDLGKRLLNRLIDYESPARLLIALAVSIFIVETIVMSVIHLLPVEPEGFAEGLLDAALLVLLLSPLLYYLFFRPFILHIRQRRRSEEALEAERNKLEAVAQSLGAGITIISRDYRTVWANDVIKKTFGDVLGDTCYRTFNKRTGICPDCGVKKIFETGADRVVHEQMGKTADGGTVWSDIIATPLRDRDGNITEVLELVYPVTERKLAEEALQQERNKLKGILDAMPDGAYIVNRDFDIQYVSPAIEREFGPADGRKCYQYFHGRTEVCLWCKNEEVFAGNSVRWEWTSSKTGKTYDLFDTPIRNDDGTISKLEFFHDVTDRKKAEDASLQNILLLRTVLETLPVGVWITDRSGRIIMGNRASQEIWGGARYVGMEDYGEYKGWWLETGRKIKPDEWAAARAIRAGESSINEEIEIECFDGKRKIILNSAVPIRNSRQEIMGAIIVNQDITKRKEDEDALREREEQYRSLYAHLQTVREQERTVIAREIHDELGQSLTALKLELSWLGRKLPPGERALIDKRDEVIQLTDSIIQSVKKISAELRPDILDDLGLSAAIEWQVRQFQKRTGIEVRTLLLEGALSVDRNASTALFRILQEALTNVARHAGASAAEVLLAVDKGMLVLTVIDNGRGIRPEEISASDSFGLMGMRERVHLLGGAFSICGERGKGTTLMAGVPFEKEIRR